MERDDHDRSEFSSGARDDHTIDPAAGDTGIPRRDYAGIGPKNYVRSDDRIREEISESLMRHPEIDASEIEVKVHDGTVTLDGSVSDRGTRHLVEEVASVSFGVRHVDNRLAVHRTDADRRAAREATERALERAPEIDRAP